MQTVSARPKSADATLKHVAYLEQALRLWHDYWYIWALLERMSHSAVQTFEPNLGSLTTTYPHLQSFLLDNYASEFQVKDFIPPEDSTAGDRFLADLPVGLKGWCSNSRRVYQLDSELQAVLEVTSLNDILWADARLPFPTFGIELARPYETNGFSIDFVLVHMAPRSEQNAGQVTFWFFDRKHLAYDAIDGDSRRSMEKLLREGKFQTLVNRAMKRAAKIQNNQGGILRIAFRNNRFKEIVREDFFTPENQIVRSEFPGENRLTLMNKAMRVIIGLSLYLKSLPPNSPHVIPVERSTYGSPAPDKSYSITKESDIFRISASFKLTRDERIFLGLEGTAKEQAAAKREFACHFREGHWRRRPGQGKNPKAEKTVEVRFTIVRRDKLAEGVLPSGLAKSLA